MSAYNEERYIRAAVQSILNQTYQKLELIVVDDGSTDSTPHTLAQIRDPRLRIIRQPNRGRSAGRNTGIHAARGEFITFIDADDLSHPQRIQKQVDYLVAHPDIDGVGAWEIVIDATGREVGREETPCRHEEIVKAYAEGRNGLNAMCNMVRASVFREIGGFRDPLVQAEDVDMWMRATERFQFACLPEYLHYYRQHPGCVTLRRKRASAFYRAVVYDLRAERLACGSDRLSRGEPIEIPDFEEESGKSVYHREMAWLYARRSHELARSGRWRAATEYAVRSWRHRPASRLTVTLVAKSIIGALLPFTRPHLGTVRASLAAALGLKQERTRGAMRASGSAKTAGMVAPLETSNPRTGELKGTLIRDEKSLAAVADEWDTLLASSDTSSSFFLSSVCMLPYWRTYGAGRTLTVVLVRDGSGKLIGAAPFYVETVGHRFSRHRRLSLLGSPESGADYLDVLARPGYRRAVLRETFHCLRRHKVRWDALNLSYILDDSPALALLAGNRLGPRLWLHGKLLAVCPYASLKPTWGEFVATLGASTRRGMKYQLNLLRRKFSEVRFQQVADEKRVPELIQAMIEYKQAKYGHFIDRDYLAWTEQAIEALRAGYLRLLVLWLDGCPACIWFSFLYGRRVFFQACSYKPEYACYRLGKVMMAYAVESAIREGAVEYDMKRGEAEYKYHWANGERRIVEVNAVPRTLRGAWINFWEYSDVMARVRRHVWQTRAAIRGAVKVVLASVARRWPAFFPRRIRERLVHPAAA